MLDQTELWDYMHDRYGLFLLDEEMDSIINIVIQGMRKEHPEYFPATTSLLTARAAKETNGKHPKPNTCTELLIKHATALAKHATEMAGRGAVDRVRAGMLPHIRPDGHGGYMVDHLAIFLTTQELNKRPAAQNLKRWKRVLLQIGQQ